MYEIIRTKKFKQNLKTLKKRNFDLNLIDQVVMTLVNGEILPKKFKDHALKGELSLFRSCHITPDWILVYRIDKNKLILVLFDTGTHSDLY